MNTDIMMIFDKAPGTLPLYEEFERQILAAYPEVIIMPKATQVSFYNTHAFAWAWPPFRKRKNWPERYMLVTFGLEYQLRHARIAESVEPYPNRWTHHVIIQRTDEIDSELMSWIDESYRFSLNKGRKRRER